jgi:hypothetical protein
MSGQAMPVYVKSRGSRRRAFSPGCANGQTVQSWQNRLEQGSTCAEAHARAVRLRTRRRARGAAQTHPLKLARTCHTRAEQAGGQAGRAEARPGGAHRQVPTDKVCPAERPRPAIKPSTLTLCRR